MYLLAFVVVGVVVVVAIVVVVATLVAIVVVCGLVVFLTSLSDVTAFSHHFYRCTNIGDFSGCTGAQRLVRSVV
jgi:hypothetical protein